MTREVAAVMRHVYTIVGVGTVVAVAFGVMSQQDADRVIELLRQLGERLGIVVGAFAPCCHHQRSARW